MSNIPLPTAQGGSAWPIGPYRAFHGRAFRQKEERALALLEADPRMASVWRTVIRHAASKATEPGSYSPPPAYVVLSLIDHILSAVDVPQNIPSIKDSLSKHNDHMRRLISNARELADELRTGFEPRSDNAAKLRPEAQKRLDAITLCAENLPLAAECLEEMLELAKSSVRKRVPTSQKAANNAEITFGVMVCDFFRMRLGQPLYETAATIVSVIFDPEGRSGDYTDRVRMAASREQKRRSGET